MLTGVVEGPDGTVLWSQPEILIYSDDTSYHTGRFSYPDLIEQDGRFWITSTNKVEARIFAIDSQLLEGLWAQVDPTFKPRPEFEKPLEPWEARRD